MNDFLLGRRGGGSHDECRGDLLAIEQRGELSAAERLALAAHLADCSSCRSAQRIFSDLAQVGEVDSRDAVRIERLSNAARRWALQGRQSSRPLRRRPSTAFGLAVGLVLLAGTASAAAWLWGRTVGNPPSPPVAERTPPRGAGVAAPAAEQPKAAALAEPRAPAPEVVPAGASVASLDRAVEGSARPSPRNGGRAVAERAALGPASLLRQASAARREGDRTRAIRLYRKLQVQFPDSAEARVASVPVGGMLLERKAPRAALAAFDAYLGSSRGGAMIPEALYGRGRALAMLGERQEEQRTWERLLADFPDTAYGPLVRRRLADLK